MIGTGFQAGDPREIRTPDTLIRSQVLYPAELLGHVAGAEGLKPPTYGFGDRCSTIELCPYGAENEIRTRDPHLGKVMLYH